MSQKNGGLRGSIESTLEDAKNGYSGEFRMAHSFAWEQYLSLVDTVETYDSCLEKALQPQPDCKKLLKTDGIGVLNAVSLYVALGRADIGTFTKGKDAACIGLTSIQHSPGSKVKLGSVGRRVKNTLLRSQLITGSMSVVSNIANRPARTKKEFG